MKLGISALLFNIKNALNLCKNIDCISHLEIGIDNLDECKQLYEYKEEIENLGLSIGIHLPMELNSCENVDYISDSWISFIKELDNELNGFNIKYINMHLGYVDTNRLIINREKYLNKSVNFIDKIKVDSFICIENVYCKKGNFSNIGNKSYDFEYIFNNSKNTNLFFCYDSGHNLIDKDDYILKLKEKIKVVHLSDNNGFEDTHIGIGKGILSKSQVKEILDLDPEYLIMEICYADIEESVKKLKKILGEV